jgi:rhodanese-related sulfurtransferase
MPNETVLILILVLAIAAIAIYLRLKANNTGVVLVSPLEGKQLVDSGAVLIDVRTPQEFATGHARKARLMPLDTLSGSLGKISKNKPVVLICASGNRSKQAARLLLQSGYENVVSVRGGIHAWQQARLPLDQ